MKFSAVIADICERGKALEKERENAQKVFRLHCEDSKYIFCLHMQSDNPQLSVWSMYDNPIDSADFELCGNSVKILQTGKYTTQCPELLDMIQKILDRDMED